MEAAQKTRSECWRCHAETTGGLACPQCAAVQPLGRDADLFAVLGLPRSLALDPVELERRYHEAARAVHPDRHQTGSREERELSLAASTAVNRAYRTLRDPVARGRYWLELHGERLADEGARVPPEIAAEVFETQERLAELRAGGSGDGALREELRGLEEALAARLAGLRRDLVTAYEATGGPALDDLRRRLAAIAYLGTLHGDVRDAVEG